ncbi:hypothetical protein PSNIH2_10165 [Pantoea sp. PSNIH2]|nr:hypothetical protein PSNIH2_10165 [Pantoea sp. PSNIH2]
MLPRNPAAAGSVAARHTRRARLAVLVMKILQTGRKTSNQIKGRNAANQDKCSVFREFLAVLMALLRRAEKVRCAADATQQKPGVAGPVINAVSDVDGSRG